MHQIYNNLSNHKKLSLPAPKILLCMGNFLKLHMQIQLVYAKSETARAIYVRNNNSEYNEPVNFKHQNNPSSLQKKSLASIPTQLPSI